MKVMIIEILDISCFILYSMKQIDNIDFEFVRMFRFIFFIYFYFILTSLIKHLILWNKEKIYDQNIIYICITYYRFIKENLKRYIEIDNINNKYNNKYNFLD